MDSDKSNTSTQAEKTTNNPVYHANTSPAVDKNTPVVATKHEANPPPSERPKMPPVKMD